MRGRLVLVFLAACAAPAQRPPQGKVAAAPVKATTPGPAVPVRQSKDKTVSVKVDATLDADALVSRFQKKLSAAGYRLVPDTEARFFITFKVKEMQTGAPPPGREIARVQCVVVLLDAKAGVRLPPHQQDENGVGSTLDTALDAALASVAEKVTPLLITEMVGRLAAED